LTSAYRRSPLTLALAAASAILFLPLAVPVMVGRIFPAGDLSAFHLPMRFLYQKALAAGDSFLWTSALESGLYLHAEGQAGMAHPWHLVIYRLLPLGIAFNVEMLGTYVFATAGAWLLLRELGLRREAALAGALAFAFSGFSLLHLNHMNAIAVVAHIPWILLATRVLLTAGDSRRAAAGFAGVAALLGSQLLLGFPQGIWYTSLAIAWMAAYSLATLPRARSGDFAGSRGGAPVDRVIWLGAAVGCGLLIGAVQLLPTLDATRTSFRSATTWPFRMSFSMHPLNLAQLWSPYTLGMRIYSPVAHEWFPHEFGLYNGAFSTLSVFWVAARYRALRHRTLAIALLGLAALGIVLALGRYGGLYPLLAQLPGISSFRAPARHIVLAHLAFAGLTGLMIDDLLDLQARRVRLPYRNLWPLAVSTTLTIGVTIAGFLATGSSWAIANDVRFDGAASALPGAALAVATAGLILGGARGWRAAVPVLIVVAALDLAWWGTRYVYSARPVPFRHVAPIAGFPIDAREQDLVHPQATLDDINKYPMWRLRSTLAYLGLPQLSLLDPADPLAQRVAGVQWRWTPAGWSAVEGTMARVRLVADWRVSGDARADVGTIDIARTALLDSPPGDTAGGPGRARLVHERPGELVIETDAPGPQLVIVAERFHTGWKAIAAGRPVRVHRAYGDFMAALVPAGTHRVTFRFSPASARWGLMLTILGLAVTALGAFALRHRRSGD
jgi:hypothetical protein